MDSSNMSCTLEVLEGISQKYNLEGDVLEF